jgi:hypothetical protein
VPELLSIRIGGSLFVTIKAGSTLGWQRAFAGEACDLSVFLATEVERLLVERIATCWLHLNRLEMVYAQKERMSLDLAPLTSGAWIVPISAT